MSAVIEVRATTRVATGVDLIAESVAVLVLGFVGKDDVQPKGNSASKIRTK
ncbi:MAG: hypothetical protein F6K09_23270 [Merismopedia sp. SIO2A8]|nr:hypothetical protein [Merismopedia sp. SIO2A8]